MTSNPAHEKTICPLSPEAQEEVAAASRRITFSRKVLGAIFFALVLIVVGQVVLWASANRRADSADRKADRAQRSQIETRRELIDTRQSLDHSVTCLALSSIYSRQYSNVARPPTAATDLDPNGGLVVPDAHTFDLSGCQDLLNTDNLHLKKGTP